MRRLLSTILLAVFLFLSASPALAEAASVPKETTDAKARVDGYVEYMTSTADFLSIDDDLDGATINLPKGLFPYVENWVGVAQAWRYGSLAALDFAVGSPGSTDSDRGEGVNGWYNYCSKHKDFLTKTQALEDRVMSAAGSPLADGETQKKLSDIAKTVADIAMKSMTVDLAKSSGTREVYGNIVCAKVLADIAYTFKNPPAGKTAACLFNIIMKPEQDFHNSGGGCSYNTSANVLRVPIGSMPGCTGSACQSSVTTQCNAGDCFWYDFRSSRAQMDSNLQKYEDLLAAEDKKLVEIGGTLAKAGMDAANLKSKLQARGTALSLPLPLSDITVEGVIGRVINSVLGVVGAIALLLFVWGGLQWMLAAGSTDKIAKAKKTIVWAALGLIAIFSSYAILNIIIEAFAK